MNRLIPYVIALFFGFCATTQPQAETSSGARKSPVLVFLGDSLTAGYGLPQESAYPALVEALLSSGPTPATVVNAGVSGDTSAGALRRIAWVLKRKPDWVVVALGGNDMLRGVSPEATRENLEKILLAAKNAGARTALLGMQASPNLGTDYRKRFDAIFPQVAKKTGTPLLPFYIVDVAGIPKLNQADGIHPTAEGQKLIADRVHRFLAPLLSGKK